MLMNLTDVFTSTGKAKNESFIYVADCFDSQGSSYPITDKTPVEIKLTNIETGKALLEGGIKLTLGIPCDRCLQTVNEHLEISFVHELTSPEVSESEDDGQSFMSGYELNIEALVNNEILVNMPVKVLCEPDCKGICIQCGRNLNEGECGCDTFVPDPRMAAIKDIFNANKEV